MKIWRNKLVLGLLMAVLLLSLALGTAVLHFGSAYEKTASVYMKSLDWVLPLSTDYQYISADANAGNLYQCHQKDQVEFRDTSGKLVKTLSTSDVVENAGSHKDWTSYKGRTIHSIWSVDKNTYAVSFDGKTPEDGVSGYMLFDENMNPLLDGRMFETILRESDGMRYFISSERDFDGKTAKKECGFLNEKGDVAFTFDHAPLCVNDFSEGLSIVYDDKLCAYDKEGNQVFALDYESGQVPPYQRDTMDEYDVYSPYFTQFADGLAPVTLDGEKMGYINTAGKLVIEPLFKEAGPVLDSTAAVCLIQSDSPSTLVKSRWGILNLKGVQ